MPSDKRARQRAGRQARMAELQRAQRRRRQTRRGIVVAVIVALAIGGVIYTGTQGSSKKVSTSSTTATTAAGSTTTAAAAGGSGSTAGLVARPAPAKSSSCATPASGPAGSGAAPATGNSVSIVPAPAHVPFPKLDGTSPRYTKFASAPPFCIDATKTYTATVVTDIGTVTVKLLPRYAPLTVNNFVFLAGYHYYDGITFHRVIPGFMDQGGDPTASGGGGPGYSFADELPSSNAAYSTGAVAMANSGANTNGSQFFIVVPGGGSGLTPSYSVFGQVAAGMSVVEKINSDGTQAGTPKTYHKIVKVTISES